MGNLTIRNVDDAVKRRLRLRAARNGRSMEEEVRVLLAARMAEDRDARADSAELVPPTGAAEPAGTGAVARTLAGRRIVLVIGGGIAAYKSLDLIRRLKERGAEVRPILTEGAQEFITPLSAGSLAGRQAHSDLFDPSSEFDIGHIRLARQADVIVVAPATADLMAKMAAGLAPDLACAVLLATDKPVLIAPAMNPRMWEHPATQRNLDRLRSDGVFVVGPEAGEMAESGEAGTGRMAEPLEIAAAVENICANRGLGPLAGRRVLVTSGPTHEPIDPVRYIANRSSGKQGHAIARAAAEAGAEVVLVSGPVVLADPPGVRTVRVESARDMLTAVQAALPADVAIFAAAVADWRVAEAGAQKLKKSGQDAPQLALVENPDILATVARDRTRRPPLVIGFAAETEQVIAHAKAKLAKKGCDWILANDVSPTSGVMGGDRNSLHLVTAEGVESWPTQSKAAAAHMLVARIAEAIGDRA